MSDQPRTNPLTIVPGDEDLAGFTYPSFDEHGGCSLCGATVHHERRARSLHDAFHLGLYAQNSVALRVLLHLGANADPRAEPTTAAPPTTKGDA